MSSTAPPPSDTKWKIVESTGSGPKTGEALDQAQATGAAQGLALQPDELLVQPAPGGLETQHLGAVEAELDRGAGLEEDGDLGLHEPGLCQPPGE